MKIINGLKVVTFNEMLKKQMKSAEFRDGYKKEVARLRLVQQIKEARIAKKYTQKKLAEKAKMPQSVIARIESGRQGMSLATVSRIASVLGKQIQMV